MCLECSDMKYEGGRSEVLFVMPYPQPPGGSGTSQDTWVPYRLRSYGEVLRVIPSELGTVPIPRIDINSRLSANELRRRHVAEIHKVLLSISAGGHYSPSTASAAHSRDALATSGGAPVGSSHANVLSSPMGIGSPPKASISSAISTSISSTTAVAALQSLLGPVTTTDKLFLCDSTVQQKNLTQGLGRGKSGRCWEGSVALATGRRHWSEQYLSVSATEVTFRKARDHKRFTMRFSLSSVLRVRPMLADECPCEGMHFFQIETFWRVYHLLVRYERLVNDWMQAFTNFLGMKISQPPVLKDIPMPYSVDPEQTLVARPADWNLRNHKVLNYHRIMFRKGSNTSKRQQHEKSPSQLIASLLDKVSQLIVYLVSYILLLSKIMIYII